MTSSDNVVSFEEAKQDSIARRILLRKLQPAIRELTNKHMHNVMQGMFDNADDALFKMAESAVEGSNKNLYMDSMRIVRLQRQTIEDKFFSELKTRFNDWEQEKKSNATSITDQNYTSLELMADADLEIQLAVDNLVQKIQSLYGMDLSGIEKRLSHLYSVETIDTKEVPFGAEAFVQSYLKATEALDLALEVQLILLKLFDLHCVHNLAGLFTAINQLFIKENVLPVIKTQIIKQDGSTTTSTQPSQVDAGVTGFPQPGQPLNYSTGQMNQPVSSPGWSQLQNLLTTHRQEMFSSGVSPGQAGAPTAGGGAGGPVVGAGGQVLVPMSTQDVLTTLSEIQTGAIDQLPEGGAHAVGNFLRVHLESAAREGDQEKSINPVDNDLIDVVCLIFEYILDDPHLPVVAKASIGRLQIPMLKVAMLDKNFFSMNGHPARYLLNLLASTAVGIDDQEARNHPVLNKINEIVEYILENFTDDISLFEQQTEILNQFISEHHQHEQTVYQDLSDQQQEKEELALARVWVKETLSQHLIGRELPKPVADIILGPWKDVMLETYLQEGEHSQLWKTQIRFIDVLCWSIEPKKLNLDKQKLGSIIQQLVKTLREGLTSIDYPQQDVAKIFNTLEPYHLASVHGMDLADCILASKDKASVTDALHSSSEKESMDAEIEKIISDEKVILEDIVLEDWEPASDLDAIDDEYLMLARHLEMGKWVEFKNPQGETRRAKLAWKSELLGEYTFLNWKFDVVADKTLYELADDLRRGQAKVVEEVPLMDRALSAVVSSLIPKAK